MDPELGRGLFVVVTALAAFNLYGAFTSLIERTPNIRQSAFVGGIIMLLGTVGIMGAAYAVQRGNPELDAASLAHGSYAAMIGDPLLIVPAGAIIAMGWYVARKHLPRWINTWWWHAFPICAGICLGMTMQQMGGRPDSLSSDIGERLHDSATSWAHNLGVVPAVAGMLIFGIVPLLAVRQTRWRYGAVALIFVAGWLALVMLDSSRAGFDPHWLDVEMNWSKWAPA
jgi:hypothetical protein